MRSTFLKMLPHARDARRMARFAIVGALNTAIDLAVFSALFYLLDVHVIVANTIAYLIAVTNSFLFNRNWVFADNNNKKPQARQFLLFVALNAVGLGISNMTIWSLITLMPAIYAKLVAVIATFAWNYWTSRKFVFTRY